MGVQLDLFERIGASSAMSVVAASEEEPSFAVAPESLAGQMDLFGDRWQRATAAHKALAAFDLNGAAEALRDAVRLYASDASLKERADVVARLATSLRGARRKTRSEAQALAAIGPKVPAFLAEHWHRNLAQLMEQEGGEGAALDGVPAGVHWLRAGDLERAEASLRATLAQEPANCRVRGYLADVLVAQDRLAEARMAYRDSLASSPSEVDIVGAADIAVRDLPLLAQEEFDLPGEPIEWAAAVGLIEGVFLPPSSVPGDWVDDVVLAELTPGLRFYRWLVAEKMARDDAQRMACRRAMKALSPRLMKALLDRRQ